MCIYEMRAKLEFKTELTERKRLEEKIHESYCFSYGNKDRNGTCTGTKNVSNFLKIYFATVGH